MAFLLDCINFSVFYEIVNTHDNTQNFACCDGHPDTIHTKDIWQYQYWKYHEQDLCFGFNLLEL